MKNPNIPDWIFNLPDKVIESSNNGVVDYLIWVISCIVVFEIIFGKNGLLKKGSKKAQNRDNIEPIYEFNVPKDQIVKSRNGKTVVIKYGSTSTVDNQSFHLDENRIIRNDMGVPYYKQDDDTIFQDMDMWDREQDAKREEYKRRQANETE
jgi:hypothetical protein